MLVAFPGPMFVRSELMLKCAPCEIGEPGFVEGLLSVRELPHAMYMSYSLL